MLLEYVVPLKHTLKILCKSKNFPRRCKRKREWVFFSEHSVHSVLNKLRSCYNRQAITSLRSVTACLWRHSSSSSISKVSAVVCSFCHAAAAVSSQKCDVTHSVTDVTELFCNISWCVKLFFCFKRQDSLRNILLTLGLPSFDTVLNYAAVYL